MPASLAAPFPPADAVVATVRKSCKELREASGISISSSKIDAFLRSLDEYTYERLKKEHGVNFPLQFASIHVEVNFLAVLALLNTLSGYRSVFHQHTGSGAYQNVIKLLFGLYIGSADDGGTGKLSAHGLASLTEDDVAGIWGVSLLEERPHESMPAVVVGKRGGAMLEVVQLVVKLCRETGNILLQGGYPDLGAFALEALKEGERIEKQKGEATGVDTVVDKLVRGIPGFADMHLVDGKQPVYLFKKAFFFVYSIHARFAGNSSFPVRLPSVNDLPMFVDNVIPTMIKHFGMIDISESSSAALQQWANPSTKPTSSANGVEEGPELSHDEAYRVRAAALDAGVAITARAKELAQAEPERYGWMSTMVEVDVDGYLWAVAKDDQALRKVPRLVEKQTIMY
ncbi:hypothetical protein K437DRAFT_259708 [Tilletiaria anomala UBC 951]|uniref:Queuosine 5'-phosphate N-glycosylase/hydrolase n=1 Tax=Tilletiaria anomala (strain ATCC 24038 / CBS 436.72 / UBC 951) TaxID=1037660 RepID=A0A066VBH4_TILAU|nr:uncharacterized protein K437DRAFT_259708 [Tilletiaria anomala UBC 951]KDN37653.1 hypothetical protein K437DRAFT_259708 [Tilletiaria anomala UBC 951]